MNWIRRLVWRFEVLFSKKRVDQELDEELRYHLEREAQANVARGMSPEAARRAALLDFGGVEKTKEEVRDTRGGRGLDDLAQDVRYAFRGFKRRPGFALMAVGLMGLGIGASSTIYSVVDGVLLEALPYPDPESLIYVDSEGSNTYPDFLAWQENLSTVQDLSARAGADGSLTGQEGPVRVRISLVTPRFLALLGGRPLFGRLFDEEDQRENNPVVVLDYGFWVRNWGADQEVVGEQLRLDGEPVVVAGVLAPGFTPPEHVTGPEVDVWTLFDAQGWSAGTRESKTLRTLGRLKPGVSLGVAQAEMDALNASLAEDFPDHFIREDGSPKTFPLVPLRDATVKSVSSTLMMLLGAVGLLLLIACANVANLFLARGTSRADELSLRGALGASQGRIARQLLTESTVLATAGGLLGVAMAVLGVEVFKRFGPGDLPRLAEVAVNPRVLAFSLILAAVTGILCGAFPIAQAVRKDLSSKLREVPGRTTPGRKGNRVRDSLLVTELALTVVLLTGAGLLFRSLLERMEVDPGFHTAERVVLPLEVGDTYSVEARAQFVTDLRARLENVPGVGRVAASWVTPFMFPPGTCCWASRIWPADSEDPGTGKNTFIHPVTEDYFATLGVEIPFGREFAAEDFQGDGMVAVINPPLARRLFGTENVAGRQIMVGGNGPVTVIGVEAGHHHWASLESEVDEGVYVPYQTWGSWFGLLHVVLESGVPLQTLGPGLRAGIAELDPEMAMGELVTMDDFVSRSLATPRFLAILFGSFAAVAFLLAAGGVYASILYSVGQRRREMGIRLALGSRPNQVTRLVLGRAGALGVVGLGVGVAVALALSRLLSGLVWGVSVTDAGTYGGVCVVLAITTLTASWVPAFRASRTDPVETLKAE